VDLEKSRVYLGSMASWGNLQRDAERQWLIAGTQSRAQYLHLPGWDLRRNNFL